MAHLKTTEYEGVGETQRRSDRNVGAQPRAHGRMNFRGTSGAATRTGFMEDEDR